MEQVIECVIAGGNEHGQIRRECWDKQSHVFPVIATLDGQLCQVAARRHRDDATDCFVLLHPLATGEQFTTLLQTLCSRHG